MNRRLIWILISAILSVSLILSACGGTPPAATQPAGAQETQPPVAAQETTEQPTQEAEPVETSPPAEEVAPPAAQASGNLVYALPSDIVSFDPHKTTETVSGMVNSQIFDYLTILTPEGDVAPSLATSWETSDDDLRWTFHLVEGVSFHDGTPFNAEAVKVNFDRVLNEDNNLPAIRLLSGVTEVNVIDESTIEIVTQEPFGPLPFHLSHYSLGIISPTALDSMSPEDLAQNPIGTGPFKFVSYTPNVEIALEANVDYWGEKPKVATVTFRPVPEAASRSVLLETGEAHIVSNISPQDVEPLGQASGVRVDVIPFTRVIFIHMNEFKEPFDNVKVRQALSMAIDRQSIVDNILKGLASVATGPLGEGVFGYSNVDLPAYNPEQAKALLAEAGYPDGFSTNLWVPAGRYQGAEESAQAIQAQLSEIGVEANVEIMEWSALLEQIRKGPEEAPFEMVMLGFAPATNDADWQMFSQFHTNSWAPLSNNRSFYSNPEVDALLEKGRFSTDPEERKQAYAEALQIIADEAPELYIYQATQIYGLRENVTGLVYLPIDIQELELVSVNE